MVRPACFLPVGRRADGAACELGRGGRRRRPARRAFRHRAAPGVPWGADRGSSVPVVRPGRVRPVGRRTGGFAGGPDVAVGRLIASICLSRSCCGGSSGRASSGAASRARIPVPCLPSRVEPRPPVPGASMRSGGAVWRKCDMARRIWSRAGFACCLSVAPMATFAALLGLGSNRFTLIEGKDSWNGR